MLNRITSCALFSVLSAFVPATSFALTKTCWLSETYVTDTGKRIPLTLSYLPSNPSNFMDPAGCLDYAKSSPAMNKLFYIAAKTVCSENPRGGLMRDTRVPSRIEEGYVKGANNPEAVIPLASTGELLLCEEIFG